MNKESSINSPFDVSISDDDSWAVITDGKGHRIRKLNLSSEELTTLIGFQGCYNNGSKEEDGDNGRFNSESRRLFEIEDCESIDGLGSTSSLSYPYGIVLSLSSSSSPINR